METLVRTKFKMHKKIPHESHFSPNFSKNSIPLFFYILFSAIICLIYTETSIVSELSENLYYKNTLLWLPKKITIAYPIIDDRMISIIDDDEVDREFAESLILPQNITDKEARLAWYRRKLPEADFLKSNELTEKFHGRVSEFLNQNCTVRFFMTWFSPAKNFGHRIFFTMESIFKNHPMGCLIIVSSTMDTNRGYETLKRLIDRGFRILAVTPDVRFLLNNTPGEDWIKGIMKGTRDPGNIPLPQNLSNLLRLAVLYKYGGAYLDTDYIVLRDMSGLRNVIGAQAVDSKTKTWKRLNNAALVFDMEHPVLYDFIKEFTTTFNGNRWGYNGPYLVSRVVERIGKDYSEHNVTVLPPKAFYPVDWVEIQRFLKKPESVSEFEWVENKLNMLNDGRTYGIHLWNARIKGLKIEEGSVLARLISEQCIVCDGILDS